MPNGNDSSSLNLKLPALPALTAMTTSATLPEVLASMAPAQPAASIGTAQPAPPPEYFAPTPALPVISNAQTNEMSNLLRQMPTNAGSLRSTTYSLPGPGTMFMEPLPPRPTPSAPPGQSPSAQMPPAQSPFPQIIPSPSSGTPYTPEWNPQRTPGAAPAPTNPLLIPQPNLSPEQALAQQSPPAGATTPFGQMTPPRPRSFGQKLLSTLGQIGGYALSAADPGLAAMIPQTPIGKIAAQQRGLEMQLTRADIAQKQAAVTSTLGELNVRQQALPSQIAEANAMADKAKADADIARDPLTKAKLQADVNQANAQAANLQAEADKNKILLNFMQGFTQGGKGQDYINTTVDKAIPPTDELSTSTNRATKAAMAAAAQMGDIKGMNDALDKGLTQVAEFQREKALATNPDVIRGKAAVTKAEEESRYGKAEFANVPPGLIPTATKAIGKATDDYTNLMTQLMNTKKALVGAKTGNEVLSSLSPVAVVMGQNDLYGSRRFSPTELHAIENIGSIGRQINQWISKVGTGTMAPESLKEMQGYVDQMIQGANQSLTNKINNYNHLYGSTVDPQNYIQSATGQAGGGAGKGAAKTYPTGARPGTQGGKHGYVLNGVFHAD